MGETKVWDSFTAQSHQSHSFLSKSFSKTQSEPPCEANSRPGWHHCQRALLVGIRCRSSCLLTSVRPRRFVGSGTLNRTRTHQRARLYPFKTADKSAAQFARCANHVRKYNLLGEFQTHSSGSPSSRRHMQNPLSGLFHVATLSHSRGYHPPYQAPVPGRVRQRCCWVLEKPASALSSLHPDLTPGCANGS